MARAFGRLLLLHGEPVVAVASRTASTAGRTASALGAAVAAVEYVNLPSIASNILIAVSDAGISSVAETLAAGGMRHGVVLHTCGARGPDALAPLQARGVACGMLHPLQSITGDTASLDGIAFGVAGDPRACAWGEEIVSIANGRIVHLDERHLGSYHTAAVMASNAIVAVMDAAIALMSRAGVERGIALDALAPLSRTTLENALRDGPLAAVTGPISRGDAATVAAHLDAVADAPPTIRHLYRAAADHLVYLARQRGLEEGCVRAVESVLRHEG